MSDLIIAVDPGSSSGAIAYIPYGELAVESMPKTPEHIFALFNKIKGYHGRPMLVYMENVGGSMPGNSAKSSRTFAEHVGHLKMACIALKIPMKKVVPQRWMRDLFGDALPSNPKRKEFVPVNEMDADKEFRKACDKTKRMRKAFIYEAMKSRYPDAKFTLEQADAVAILTWALKEEGVVHARHHDVP